MSIGKALIIGLAILAPTAHADVYRCESAQGTVFSDQPCGKDAAVVVIRDVSDGITPGPPEEVREYLAQKREERETQRAERREAARQAAARSAPPVVTVERPVYPAWWGPSRYPPQRPGPPGNRPRPQPPIMPPPEPLPPADAIDLRRR